jgi:tRNA(fMet)-specific endonuclease VapC
VSYFLDTNICIYLLKGLFPVLRRKLLSFSPDKIKVPAIVAAELLYGAKKSRKMAETLETVYEFLRPLKIISFDMEAAQCYGDIRADLGYNDMVIAATVLSKSGILVTNNTKEFSRIGGLAIENWTRD